MRILYPTRIDVSGAMGEYHRNLATHLSEKTISYIGPNSDLQISPQMTTIKLSGNSVIKAYQYLQPLLEDIDVIHTGPFYHHIIYSKTPNSKVVHTLHNVEQYKGIKRARNVRRRMLMDSSDELVAPSQYIADSVPHDREITIIPNGVDTTTFNPEKADTNQNTFFYIAGDWPRKNLCVVLKLAKNNPESQFRIRAPNIRESNRMVAENQDNIDLLPYLEHGDLAEIYASSEAVLCPFEREGFGLVVIESLSSGTPVIGYRSGNIPNLIDHGTTGVLCESLNLNEWTEALSRVKTTSSRQCRKTALQYDWDVIAKKYQNLYRSL